MIYLASPYSDPDPKVQKARFEAACAAVAFLLERGKHVFSPIVHYHPVAERHDLPGSFEFWQECNRDMIDRCDQFVILRLDGWDHSIGVKGEMRYARHTRKAVGYMADPRSMLVDGPALTS